VTTFDGRALASYMYFERLSARLGDIAQNQGAPDARIGLR
jgi:hypothetical protein